MGRLLEPILVAEDDPDDRLLIREAFDEAGLVNPLHFAKDGVELLDHLHRRDKFAHLSGTALPCAILLDLNMPRMDGREALAEIKEDEILSHIPVVILTTSTAEEDISKTIDLGATSFAVKPTTFNELVQMASSFMSYCK